MLIFSWNGYALHKGVPACTEAFISLYKNQVVKTNLKLNLSSVIIVALYSSALMFLS